MPASPRTAAIGLGSAVFVALGIPLAAGIIATYQMQERNQRADVRAQFEDAIEQIRLFGAAEDRFPTPEDGEFWQRITVDLAGVTGEYTVYGDGFAIHRLPKSVVAVVQQRVASGLIEIPLGTFETDQTLGDILGSSNGIGIAVAFANGQVFMLKDSTPAEALRPFLARNTAVVSEIKDLELFQVR